MSIRRSQTSELGVRFPALVTLCASYVNVEWDEFGDPQGAVRAFLTDFPDKASAAAEGIAAVLDEYDTEADRYHALGELGWGYWGPPGTLESFLIWSGQVLQRPADVLAEDASA